MDLTHSSIRPSRDDAWFAALRRRVLASVAGCEGGEVVVHTGTWLHDLDQVGGWAGCGAGLGWLGVELGCPTVIPFTCPAAWVCRRGGGGRGGERGMRCGWLAACRCLV